MNVLFMGTPDFAIPPLQALIASQHTVKAVFTQPDKPKGRGYKLAAPPVKELALEHGIPVHQPAALNNGEGLTLIEQYKPDIIVVVAYGKILPKEILEFPPYGCINIHASLLPKYRGAAPVQWSIINGEKRTGVTIMQMDEGLDTGNIIIKRETPIGENETASELFERLSVLGADALMDALDLLKNGIVQSIPQDHNLASHTVKITKDMCTIDFTKPAQEVHNFIRGLSAFPSAKTKLRGKLLKVYRTKICRGVKGIPGQVSDGKKFIVACGQDGVQLLEVQYEGSKKMDAKSFINGIQLKDNEQLE